MYPSLPSPAFRPLQSIALGLLLARASLGAGIPELFQASYQQEAQGSFKAALNSTLQVLRLSPRSYLGNLRAGWLLYRMQRYEESQKRYRKADKLAPRALEPRVGIMLPLMALRRWGEVEKLALHLLKYDPLNYTLLSRLAYVYFSTGRYGEAVERYQQVLDLYPSDTQMQLGLAWTYVRMQRRKEAERWFQTVLQVQPDSVSARSGLEAIQRTRSQRGIRSS